MKRPCGAQISWTSVPLAGVVIAFTGCMYETRSTVRIPVLDIAYPVSASPHYVKADGAIVRDAEYKVVERFQFQQTVESPHHGTSDVTLRLGPDIDRIIEQAHGDAVTRLTIDAVSYETGSHGAAAFWKNMAWIFTPIGASFIGAGIGWDQAGDRDRAASLYAVGSAFAGIGVLSIVIATVLHRPATWRYEVSGQVVKVVAEPSVSLSSP